MPPKFLYIQRIYYLYDSGDRRYEGEWETDTAEGGTYHVDIVASDGVLKTKKDNAAMFEVVSDTAGP